MMNPFLAALEGIGILTGFLALLFGLTCLCAEAQEKIWAKITLTVMIVIVLGSIIGLGLNGYLD